EKVERALSRIRGYLRRDGGDIKLVEVTPEGVVKVRLMGVCAGCPYAMQTLHAVVEREIKKEAPEVKRVIAV
ncbi:NifU family protein, partial [bacterium]